MKQPVSGSFGGRSLPPCPFFLFPFSCDDGHGDYNRSYDKDFDDFDYADYSTDKEDNNFRTREKKKRKTQKQIIEDILNRWD